MVHDRKEHHRRRGLDVLEASGSGDLFLGPIPFGEALRAASIANGGSAQQGSLVQHRAWRRRGFDRAVQPASQPPPKRPEDHCQE